MLGPFSHGIYNRLLRGHLIGLMKEWASDTAGDRYSKEMSLTLVTPGYSQLCPQGTALATWWELNLEKEKQRYQEHMTRVIFLCR